METDEWSFPLTKSNSEAASAENVTDSVARNKEPVSSVSERPRFRFSSILKKIVMAFGRSAESNQYYYFLARSSEEDEDESDSDPELDSCSL